MANICLSIYLCLSVLEILISWAQGIIFNTAVNKVQASIHCCTPFEMTIIVPNHKYWSYSREKGIIYLVGSMSELGPGSWLFKLLFFGSLVI